MIQIGSARYNDLAGQSPEYRKFHSLQYTIVGSADYIAAAVIPTAWRFTLVVSASGSALGGGVSAGGLDTLRASYAATGMVPFVSNEAVTASAYLTGLSTQQQLNPTMYLMNVSLARAA